MKYIVLVVFVVLFSTFAFGQQKEVMTNDDVITLTSIGLSEELIIKKIQSSICGFDLTSTGLVQLVKAGVTSAVLDQMMVLCKTPDVSTDKKVKPTPVNKKEYANLFLGTSTQGGPWGGSIGLNLSEKTEKAIFLEGFFGFRNASMMGYDETVPTMRGLFASQETAKNSRTRARDDDEEKYNNSKFVWSVGLRFIHLSRNWGRLWSSINYGVRDKYYEQSVTYLYTEYDTHYFYFNDVATKFYTLKGLSLDFGTDFKLGKLGYLRAGMGANYMGYMKSNLSDEILINGGRVKYNRFNEVYGYSVGQNRFGARLESGYIKLAIELGLVIKM